MMSRLYSPLLRCSISKQHTSSIDRLIRSEGARHISTSTSLASNASKDYYAILGVKRGASTKDIKSAYYDKAKTYHPDANSSNETVAKFQEISEAYEILGDEQKRRFYDSTRRDQSIAASGTYGKSTASGRDKPYRPSQGPTEPINLRHLNHVYKVLNRPENEEQPNYMSFDHNYPGTTFNRFEFSRSWDRDRMCWVYIKRSTADDYNEKKLSFAKDMTTIYYVVFLGIGGFFFFNNVIQSSDRHVDLQEARRPIINRGEMLERMKADKASMESVSKHMKFD